MSLLFIKESPEIEAEVADILAESHLIEQSGLFINVNVFRMQESILSSRRCARRLKIFNLINKSLFAEKLFQNFDNLRKSSAN